MNGHRPKNKNLLTIGRTPHNHNSDSTARTAYVYDPKNNTDTRIICRTCVYREFIDGNKTCCMCFVRSGVPRDTNATNNHCATYKFGAAKKKVTL